MRKLILCICLFFISSRVFAALAESYGFYVEGNVGLGPDQHITGNANAGYKINDYFGIEAGYALFSKIKCKDSNYFFDAALKGILPFDSGFSVFGKAGMAEAHSVDTYKPAVYLGIGLGYDFTPKLEGTVQIFTTTENDIVPAMYAGTIGLTFLF
jgi:hypothetical protein